MDIGWLSYTSMAPRPPTVEERVEAIERRTADMECEIRVLRAIRESDRVKALPEIQSLRLLRGMIPNARANRTPPPTSAT